MKSTTYNLACIKFVCNCESETGVDQKKLVTSEKSVVKTIKINGTPKKKVSLFFKESPQCYELWDKPNRKNSLFDDIPVFNGDRKQRKIIDEFLLKRSSPQMQTM